GREGKLAMTTTPTDTATAQGEQSRAVYPDGTGHIERDGVRVFYEVYGAGEKTVVLVPTWAFTHSRSWKAQIGPLSRRYRVIAIDPRGNGRSDRPASREQYTDHEYARDVLDVMDATDTRSAVLISNSSGVQRAMLVAVEYPDRVDGFVTIGPFFLGSRMFEGMVRLARTVFDRPLTSAWKMRLNAPNLAANYDEYVDWFTQQLFNVDHSTKHIEDAAMWARETAGQPVADSWVADLATPANRRAQREMAERIECPVLVIHGKGDQVVPLSEGKAFAGATCGELAIVPDGTHLPHARKPAEVNRLLIEFCKRVLGPGEAVPGSQIRRRGRKRALFVSSPIGLGHARRDLAIARALREHAGVIDIEWFTQQPVTSMLEREGERIHPATQALALETAHIESESAEHDLHCFHSHRRMDEILIHNYMVFHDVVTEGNYDVVIGDEAWDVDHFTHEHPEMKKAPFVWLTDFVGWLPMDDGGASEKFLTTDYNAEMVGHIEQYPTVRDRSIFVGNPHDIVPGTFGRNLPDIRRWTEQHYDFSGYVTGFDPASLADREELREELGYHEDEQVCIVTVGGSGVGETLIRRMIEAHPLAAARVNGLRMIVVAGPRIDPASLPDHPGVEVRPYVHDLYKHLAACDLAVVQGGLTTSMELTASGRPFIYIPLQHHFEQEFHVRHRLQRYEAGRHLAFADANPDHIAQLIAEETARNTNYRPVETDGATNAAAMIAELL
ncbi:MAG: alpha/beta fold hydrolase, partial [Microthrixaceae bacterium]